jgi:hypothetical protein
MPGSSDPRISWSWRGVAAGATALALLMLVGPNARAFDLIPHSFSHSKQFVVYSREGALRNAIGTLGDDTKNGVLHVLGLRDDWNIPIVVDLRPPDPGLPDARPPVQLTLAQSGDGMKIELDLLTGDAGRGTRIQDELVRATLLALAYRHATNLPVGRPYTMPPPWLVEGISAYLDNQETGAPASMYAALLPTLQTMSVTDLLSKDPATLDSTSRAVYRACAFNLVCLLLRDLPGGRDEFVAFLGDLPNTEQAATNSGETLPKYFPELASSPDALAKWWALALAQLAAGDGFTMFTAEETEHRLQALLTFPGPVPKGKGNAPAATVSLADYKDFTPYKQNGRILLALRNGLVLLSGQANPSYRPIIVGYQEVVASLLRDRTHGVGERLRVLDQMRHYALEQREGIVDYVNWFEATQVSTQSSAFDEYFHASRQLDTGRRIHRPDPISAYLDSLDTEFQ